MRTQFTISFFTIASVNVLGKLSNATDTEHKGCSAPYTLPDWPFMVVWNVPSGGCDAQGYKLNLSMFDIVSNPGDAFQGRNMVIFYGLGSWPLLSKNGSVANNGGVPQRGNFDQHAVKILSVTKKEIPDPGFSGYSVVDFEAWRPYFYWNFDNLSVYQKYSEYLVRKEHPTWTNKTQIMEDAVNEFDAGARKFMEGTLLLARKLRPHGYWGYYGMPRCYHSNPSNDSCPRDDSEQNDKYTGWLYQASTGLYPRIYTNRKSSVVDRYRYVRQTVNETLRVQAKWTGLHAPVMPYTLSQDSGTDFFQKGDLDLAIGEPAAMGASGVVIWGSSGLFHTKNECRLLSDDINNVLGPYVKTLTDFTRACASGLCNGHGRCVRKDYEETTQNYLRKYKKETCLRNREEYVDLKRRRRNLFGTVYDQVKQYDNYVCRCVAGWTGEYCDKKAKV